MKKWNTLKANVDLIMHKHYTKGRGSRRIDKVDRPPQRRQPVDPRLL